MPVFQWRQSWGSFEDLERQVDRLLAGIRIPFPSIRLAQHYPPVNLYELPEEFLLTAELPGVEREELELLVRNGVLTLKGQRSGPAGIDENRFRRHERLWGSWQRSISLPERIDEERVVAEFNDGVLRIHLPKAPDTQPRQIPVQATLGNGNPDS